MAKAAGACSSITGCGSAFVAFPSRSLPQASRSNCQCCMRGFQPGMYDVMIAKEIKGLGLMQMKLSKDSRRIHASSPSSPLATDSSSPEVPEKSEEDNVNGTQSRSGVWTKEEKDAVIAFAGLTDDDSDVATGKTGEGRDSILSLQSESEDQKDSILPMQSSSENEEKVSSLSLELSNEQHQQLQLEEAMRRETRVKPFVYLPKKRVKGHGAVIADIIDIYNTLLERPVHGNGMMLAAAGSAVLERLEEEVEVLRGVEDVSDQLLFEILRVVKLMHMDLQLISAARKDTTLTARVDQTKVHCGQVYQLAAVL